MSSSLNHVLFGTLRRRLIFGVAVVHAVLMLLFLLDVTQRQKQMILERQVEQASALANMLSTSSAGWLASRDLAGLQELVESQRKYPELQFAMLLDMQGRVQAHTDHGKLGLYLYDLPQKAEQAILSPGPQLVDVVVPVQLGGRAVGWARVGIGQQVSQQRLASITCNGVLYAMGAILVGSLMAWLMGRAITKRLYAIQQVIDQIRSGNSRARISLQGTDEAARLATEFNTMLDHLDQRSAERDRAEEEVQKNEAFLQSVVENIPAMVFIKDAVELRFVSLNKEAEDLLGISRGDMIGKCDHDFFPAEQADHFVRFDQEVLASAPRIFETEEPIQTRTGSRMLLTKKIGILDRHGIPRYLLGISEDISKRKELELAQLKAYETAEATSRAKSEFLCMVSHELRTPLNAVMGGIQLLKMSEMDDEQYTYLNMIEAGAEHELLLVGKLLDITGIEAGAIRAHSERFSLKNTLDSICQLYAPVCREKGLTLMVNYDEALPAWLWGDAVRIHQIVSLLLENAVKFTLHGGLTLAVTRLQADQDTVRLAIAVCDTGVGIPVEMHSRIFEPFTQVDMSNTRRFGGLGMGLTICKRLVELIGGTLRVESEPDSGSCFTFEFSCRFEGSAIAAPECNTQKTVTIHTPHILVVEDDPSNRLFVQQGLQKLGYSVETADNGIQALDRWRSERFDIVLMDLQMPQMDGLEALRQIRACHGKGAQVPIIALTADARKDTKTQMLAAGFNGYLIKPVMLPELKSEIQSMLSGT